MDMALQTDGTVEPVITPKSSRKAVTVPETVTDTLQNTPEWAEMESVVNQLSALSKRAGEPVSKVVDLTPLLASVLLARNPGNRKIIPLNVARMVHDMERGQFVTNGESIIVANDGTLVDGQHRCEAVRRSGKTVQIVLVVGVEPDARLTVDQGLNRRPGDYLQMQGFVDVNALSSAGYMVYEYKTYGQIGVHSSKRGTKADMVETVRHYHDLPHHMDKAIGTGQQRKVAEKLAPRSFWGFIRFALAEVATDRAIDEFLNGIFTGAGLSEGSPLLYLRNKLFEISDVSKDTVTARRLRSELVFKAWNYWANGATCRLIRTTGGPLPKLTPVTT